MLRERERKKKNVNDRRTQRTGWISSRCLVNCTRTAKNSTAGTAATRGYGARNESSYNPRSRRSAPVPLPLPLPFQVSFPFFHRAAGKQYFQVDRVNQQSFFFPMRLCSSRLTYLLFFTTFLRFVGQRNAYGTTEYGLTSPSKQERDFFVHVLSPYGEFWWPRNNGE